MGNVQPKKGTVLTLMFIGWVSDDFERLGEQWTHAQQNIETYILDNRSVILCQQMGRNKNMILWIWLYELYEILRVFSVAGITKANINMIN